MQGLLVVLCLTQPILSIVSKVLFSMWIYKDARKKNLQSIWWIIGVVFFSWVPVVIYLVYSKDKPEGLLCNSCNTYNFHNGDFCVRCGNHVNKVQKNDKGLLYGGIITCIISIILAVIAGVVFAINIVAYEEYKYASDYDYYYDYNNEYIDPFENSYYEGISTASLKY